MALTEPAEDEFEDTYTYKFMSLTVPHGKIMEYKRDRAAIDIGLHLKSDGIITDK